MIDLHTHTTYSDGTWSVEELLNKAENTQVSILSITDHDTALAHINMKDINIKKFFSGKIIVGGEFSAIFNNVKLELLGYNFDSVKLQKWIDVAYLRRNDDSRFEVEFYDMLNLCKNNNITTTANLPYDKVKKYPIHIIYEDIIKYPQNKIFFSDEEWNSKDCFFRNCTSNTNFLLYRDFSDQYPTAYEVARCN